MRMEMALISGLERALPRARGGLPRTIIPNRVALPRLFGTEAIDSSLLTVELTDEPKIKIPHTELKFGCSFTDHMLEIDWKRESGWENPKISKFRNFEISPAASCLHYAVECFEGMKAYKDKDGGIRLFRPDKNLQRMAFSMQRMAMPDLDQGEFLECIKALLRVDSSWFPEARGYSLYLRPTCIGTHPLLGLGRSDAFKLFCILSPVGPYYPAGFRPVALRADAARVRAWPGGVGNAKVGGNYGPTIEPQLKANKEGYQQVLWLFGENHSITEVGSMNLFFLIRQKESGRPELVTAPLTRGDILPGVTRDSVLALGRERRPDLDVAERFLTMAEVVEASDEGRLMECFGAGTAAIVCPVNSIHYMGKDITLPTGSEIGPVAQYFFEEITAIQYGDRSDHPWSVLI